MFTGLVEEMGEVLDIRSGSGSFVMTIGARKVLEDVRFGESISVEGVCLSVMTFTDDKFEVGLAPETLSRTTLGDLKKGSPVNLERSVLPTTRLGGHYVQGHVDGTGEVREVKADADALLITIGAPPHLMKYVVSKGYIAIDGTSLTVIDTGPDHFTLTLISHSRPLVTLGLKQPGTRVNLEVDIMAKYAEKILTGRNS